MTPSARAGRAWEVWKWDQFCALLSAAGADSGADAPAGSLLGASCVSGGTGVTVGVGVEVGVAVVGVGAESPGGIGTTVGSGGAAAVAEGAADTPSGGGPEPFQSCATPPSPREPPCMCFRSSSARGPLSPWALPAASGDLDLNAFGFSANTRRETAGSPGAPVTASTRGSGGRATNIRVLNIQKELWQIP